MIFNSNATGIFDRNKGKKVLRPTVRPETAPIDWLLEALAILGTMILVGFAIYQYPRLPEIIPTHFNASGAVDDFSSRSTFLMLPAIGVFIYILLTLLALIPYQFNYSVKITPANALKQYTFAIRLIRYMKTVLIWSFFYISNATVNAAANRDSGLGVWFLPIFFGFLFVPVIVYLIIAFKHR